MQNNFKQEVRKHIDDFLRTNTKLFYNERDFWYNGQKGCCFLDVCS